MDEKVYRLSPPPLAEERDAVWKDTGGGPSPSGVQKGHRSRVGVEKVDGHTVSNGDRQENTGFGRGVPVRGSLRLSDAGTDPIMDDDTGFVDLAGMYHRREGRSQEQIVPPGRGQF